MMRVEMSRSNFAGQKGHHVLRQPPTKLTRCGCRATVAWPRESQSGSGEEALADRLASRQASKRSPSTPNPPERCGRPAKLRETVILGDAVRALVTNR